MSVEDRGSAPAPNDRPGRPAHRLRAGAGAAALATMAQTAIALVLYSYLIRTVGATDVGVWVSLLAVGLLLCAVDLGLSHALIRRTALAEAERDLPAMQESLETLFWCVAVMTGSALGLAWFCFEAWSTWLALGPESVSLAQALLPWLFFGLWFNRMAELLSGSLDGQQQFVARSAVTIMSHAAGLALTLVLVPRMGLKGAGLAFVLQNGFLLCGYGYRLFRVLPGVRWLRPRWRAEILMQSLRYGLSVQGLVVCYLVLESTTKLALVRAGDLPAASYFDLAFKIGKGVRSLLASALRVLVPSLVPSDNHSAAVMNRHRAYALSFGTLLVIALPLFVGLIAYSPLIARAVIGRPDMLFEAAIVIVLASWLAYSLTDATINLALASGHMRWPLLGHVVTAVLVACTLFEALSPTTSKGLFSWVGTAMLIGCVVTLAGIHRAERMPWSTLTPLRSVAWVGLAAVLVMSVVVLSRAEFGLGLWARTAIAGALHACFVVALWRLHPSAGWLLGKLMASRSGRALEQPT